jgi:hypothetical protein
MGEGSRQLSKEECLAKASECRDLARVVVQKRHRIMLEHIADTWERMAEPGDD